jgi:hypothetical protein
MRIALGRDSEPCTYCGREADECICPMALDFPNDVIRELDTDYLNWDFYEEGDDDEVDRG